VNPRTSPFDHKLAGKLPVDSLPLKHQALGLRDEQSADPREYPCALGDLIAQFGNDDVMRDGNLVLARKPHPCGDRIVVNLYSPKGRQRRLRKK